MMLFETNSFLWGLISRGFWRVQDRHIRSLYMELWGPYKWGFPTMVVPNKPMGFLTKNDHFGVWVLGGFPHHLRKHPNGRTKQMATKPVDFLFNPSNRSCRLRNERPNQQPLGWRKSSTCHCWVDLWGLWGWWGNAGSYGMATQKKAVDTPQVGP